MCVRAARGKALHGHLMCGRIKDAGVCIKGSALSFPVDAKTPSESNSCHYVCVCVPETLSKRFLCHAPDWMQIEEFNVSAINNIWEISSKAVLTVQREVYRTASPFAVHICTCRWYNIDISTKHVVSSSH